MIVPGLYGSERNEEYSIQLCFFYYSISYLYFMRENFLHFITSNMVTNNFEVNQMKKTIAFLLVTAFFMALSSCNTDPVNPGPSTDAPDTEPMANFGDNIEEPEDTTFCLIFQNGFQSLAELEAVLKKDDAAVEEYMKEYIYKNDGQMTREEIESLMATLREIYMPYMEDEPDTDWPVRLWIEAGGKIITINYMLSGGVCYVTGEERYREYQFSVFYEAGSADENIPRWMSIDHPRGKLSPPLKESTEDLIIYAYMEESYNYGKNDARQTFILNANGLYVFLNVWNAPDFQSAVEGILAFEYNGMTR